MNDLVRKLQERIDSGVSRRQIGERCGVSDGTIRNILRGQTVSIDIYRSLARYFGFDLETVFRMAEILPPLQYDGRITREGLLHEINHALAMLTDSEQAEILSHIYRLEEQRERRAQSQNT